jgi:hypothetical protein
MGSQQNKNSRGIFNAIPQGENVEIVIQKNKIIRVKKWFPKRKK